MKLANAVDIVGMLGQRLERERTGWRDVKALLIVVGSSDQPAADLADALGVHPEDQERIYHEIRQEATQP